MTYTVTYYPAEGHTVRAPLPFTAPNLRAAADAIQRANVREAVGDE